MMRFSENEKRKILREGHERGRVKEVCERNGISIRTYYRWQGIIVQQEERRMAEIRALQRQNDRLKEKFAEAHQQASMGRLAPLYVSKYLPTSQLSSCGVASEEHTNESLI